MLINKFSKNNDADLFNKILKQRENKLLNSIDTITGLIPRYTQLIEQLSNCDFNEANERRFR
jgi:hypothetical protein